MTGAAKPKSAHMNNSRRKIRRLKTSEDTDCKLTRKSTREPNPEALAELKASSHRRPDDQPLLDGIRSARRADAAGGGGWGRGRCRRGEAVVVVGRGEGRARRRGEGEGRAQRLQDLLRGRRPAAADPRHVAPAPTAGGDRPPDLPRSRGGARGSPEPDRRRGSRGPRRS